MAINTGSNFLEGLFVFWANGNYTTPPISNMPTFGDIPINQIVYIRNKQLPNINGTPINAFQVFVQNPKAVGNSEGMSELWIQAQNFLPSLQALQTYLNTSGINEVNSFSLYSGLLQIPIPFQAIGDYNGGILLNDAWTMLPRKYSAGDPNSPNGNGVTYLKLNVINRLEYLQVMVNGDQTISGDYYYNYYL